MWNRLIGESSHRAFRFAVIGAVLGLIGPVLDAIGGATADNAGSILIAVSIVVQAASVAVIVARARRSTPAYATSAGHPPGVQQS
jgi:hypothetical protein